MVCAVQKSRCFSDSQTIASRGQRIRTFITSRFIADAAAAEEAAVSDNSSAGDERSRLTILRRSFMADFVFVNGELKKIGEMVCDRLQHYSSYERINGESSLVLS